MIKLKRLIQLFAVNNYTVGYHITKRSNLLSIFKYGLQPNRLLLLFKFIPGNTNKSRIRLLYNNIVPIFISFDKP